MMQMTERRAHGVDSPLGRSDVMLSSITGGYLRYFTPDPLPDLVARCCAEYPIETESGRHNLQHLPLLSIGVISQRAGCVDHRMSKVLVDVAQSKVKIEGCASLFEVAQKLELRASRFREQMVYADALIPSEASIIYAHHEMLPLLIDSLLNELRSPLKMNSYLYSVLVGFFCSLVHPFLDGNGRWSRVVSASVGEKCDA